jgi:hypothetical protein
LRQPNGGQRGAHEAAGRAKLIARPPTGGATGLVAVASDTDTARLVAPTASTTMALAAGAVGLRII